MADTGVAVAGDCQVADLVCANKQHIAHQHVRNKLASGAIRAGRILPVFVKGLSG